MRFISRARTRKTTASTRAASTITIRTRWVRAAYSTDVIGRRLSRDAARNGPPRHSERSDYQLAGEAAHVDLEIEPLDRRPRVMPDQPAGHGAARDELVGDDGVDVIDRVDLRRGDIAPAEAERAHAPLHRAEDVTRLVAHAVGGLVAEPDDALGIAAGAIGSLTAAGRDKALPRTRHGIAEGVQRRLGRRIDFGA